METQVPGPIVPNCRKLRDLMPPPPPEGYGYLYARLNAIMARHAVMAIKHLSCLNLEKSALIS